MDTHNIPTLAKYKGNKTVTNCNGLRKKILLLRRLIDRTTKKDLGYNCDFNLKAAQRCVSCSEMFLAKFVLRMRCAETAIFEL